MSPIQIAAVCLLSIILIPLSILVTVAAIWDRIDDSCDGDIESDDNFFSLP